MASNHARFCRLFRSGTRYDPDRLAYDQQKLRQFYLTEGYADFRVSSAVAELTPNKRDFIITYVVEEGDRYKFGDVTVQSDIRFAARYAAPSCPNEERGLVQRQAGRRHRHVHDGNGGSFRLCFCEIGRAHV